ncbi:MAG: ISNCY family transposase [Candidatus Omnitrophica bacterium]|nr:ISNCY family transposase [Candidatus Omnitrophota bacterium]
MNKQFIITMKDLQRYRVLKDVLDKKLKGSEAALALGLSYVHISRLKKKVEFNGLEGLLRPRHPALNKIPDSKARVIAGIYKDHYWDFNIMHFRDKLLEVHDIKLSYESIRKILILSKIHIPKKKKIIHRRRRRMPKAGMLVQMDSSQHNWVEGIKEPWHLIAMIDDATNEVACAQFFLKDTTLANMRVIRHFIERKGSFLCLYADKASHFTTTRHQGIHYNVNPEQDDTQIERALEELGINLIPANSPQAKGRVERLFRLFQDRLIKEMRLAKIKNYTQADRFIDDKFLPWYNARFAKKDVESVYMPVPVEKNLELILCVKKERIVNYDNTVQICKQVIQIPPSDLRLSFAKAAVDLCLLEDNRIFVLYKNKVIAESKLSGNNKILKKERYIENFLNSRQYELATV